MNWIERLALGALDLATALGGAFGAWLVIASLLEEPNSVQLSSACLTALCAVTIPGLLALVAHNNVQRQVADRERLSSTS